MKRIKPLFPKGFREDQTNATLIIGSPERWPAGAVLKTNLMLIQFTLSMPNVGSWNGKWSGRENLYAVRKASMGFCGYGWMIDSTVADGAIYGPTRPKPEKQPASLLVQDATKSP